MKDVNKVILIGRLGKDPVLKSTVKGGSYSYFTLATTRKWKRESETGEDKLAEETQWHNVVAWGRQGETCAEYLKKGQTIYVEGMIRQRKYEDKEGKPRTAYEVHADSVSFLSARRPSQETTAETLMN
jgi:single-strand DNA-binding protein